MAVRWDTWNKNHMHSALLRLSLCLCDLNFVLSQSSATNILCAPSIPFRWLIAFRQQWRQHVDIARDNGIHSPNEFRAKQTVNVIKYEQKMHWMSLEVISIGVEVSTWRFRPAQRLQRFIAADHTTRINWNLSLTHFRWTQCDGGHRFFNQSTQIAAKYRKLLSVDVHVYTSRVRLLFFSPLDCNYLRLIYRQFDEWSAAHVFPANVGNVRNELSLAAERRANFKQLRRTMRIQFRTSRSIV